MKPTSSILLADEDPVTREFLSDHLTADGYAVWPAEDKATALAALETAEPDLVICDVNGDTLDLLHAIRHGDGVASRRDPDVPLIILTQRADELARVRYLDRGGDDVVSKPLRYAELRARIGALLRRSQLRNGSRVTRVGALHINHAARDVRIGDSPIILSPKEYSLLTHLATEPARVFTKQQLLRDVWGYQSPGRTRTLDSHACRLRRVLAQAGGGRWIENVWGVGYRLAPLDAQTPRDTAA